MKIKTMASILSWLGGLAVVVVGYAFLIRGRVVTHMNADGSTSTQIVPFHGRVFVLWACYLAFLLLVLLWRQRAVAHGHKYISGTCTLLFVSPIGGLLTLLIPEKDLW